LKRLFEELLSTSRVVYGLRLAASSAIPGLPLRLDSEVPDVRIWLRDLSAFPSTFLEPIDVFHTSPDVTASGQPILRVGLFRGGEHFGFFYGDGVRFAVERSGRELWADWPENYSLEDACTYLLGPVMGFVLRLHGVVCLHASAVAVGDRAIALVGLPGAGKSTTAAAFAAAGFPVLSDDILALADQVTQFLVQPGYPRVNLWPDSVRGLFGSEDALPRITPTWDKRYLPLGQNGHHFAASPLPLGAIYILDSRESSLTAPIIEEVPGKEAFIELVANTYVNYLLDQDMRRMEFDVLGRVVSEIPVRRVRPPAKCSAIFNLCEAIAGDAKRVMIRAPATAAAVRG
jgi:hypothetical protein